uniref:Uncharacterized protein n=1 Tax=Arion vulgaris TaxID=1028688 RepID=A0A0B6Z6C3_9EUPU
MQKPLHNFDSMGKITIAAGSLHKIMSAIDLTKARIAFVNFDIWNLSSIKLRIDHHQIACT